MAPPAFAQADPFYTRLLEAGSRELSLDRYEEATEDLRLACFGLLDEPAVLMRGLVLLAVAQHGTQDSAGLERTIDRILEVEERFGVYAEAVLPEAAKQRFEGLFVRLASKERVEGVPAFSQLVERAQLPRVEPSAGRPGKKRAASDSAEPLTVLALALADLEHGKSKQALRRLNGLVQTHPGIREARCLRFQANAALHNCAAMVVDMPFCRPPPVSPEEARSQLQCLVERRQWSAARSVVASLDPDMASKARIGKLLARIDKQAPSSPPAPVEQLAEASAPESQVEPAASVAEPSQGERRVLADAEMAVESASDLAAIEEHLQRVQEIADSYPELTEASLLVGRLAYRASRWQIAVRYLERSQGLEGNSSLQFYFAVALYEIGDLVQAAETLRQAMPGLEQTSFVKGYETKILGADGVGESG